MTKADKEIIEHLVTVKVATSDVKREALRMYRKYIDPQAVFCLSCDSNVRTLFYRLKTWWNSQTVAYTFIKEIKPKTKQND